MTSPAEAARLLASSEAILFDWNGTISLDEPVFKALYVDMAAEFGLNLDADAYDATCIGRSDPEICLDLAHGDRDLAARIWARVRSGYLDRVQSFDTVPTAHADLVRALADRGVTVGVVTGSSKDLVVPVARRAGILDRLSVLVTFEDITVGKPDPEGFLLGARRLGRHPRDVLAVEDSPAGAAAAANAGMRCLLVGELASTHAAPGWGVTSLAEVSPYLSTLD